MRNSGEIVPDCKIAPCTFPLYTGRCLDECLKRYRADLGINCEAKWKSRAEHNDFIWTECSNCGFKVEAYKAVVSAGSDTDYVAVKYNFCPICGKRMGV